MLSNSLKLIYYIDAFNKLENIVIWKDFQDSPIASLLNFNKNNYKYIHTDIKNHFIDLVSMLPSVKRTQLIILLNMYKPKLNFLNQDTNILTNSQTVTYMENIEGNLSNPITLTGM